MDHLDEDTLIWDNDNGQVKGDADSESQVKLTKNCASSSHEEFLRHFIKAENQLINISTELLATTLKISSIPEPDNLSTIRELLIKEINEIKTKATSLNYPIAVIDKLCFLYAVVLDEFIIYSEWGEKCGWENRPLLSQLFGMRNGGELFFSVAEKAVRQPQKMIDLLEVIYIFLHIGFKGQYRNSGSEQLKAFILQLEQIVSHYRVNNAVYCHLRRDMPAVRKPSRKRRYVITTLFFCCLIGTSVGLTTFWYQESQPQRARDFNNLEDFSQRYILSGEVSDITYISSDDDLEFIPRHAPQSKVTEGTTSTSNANIKSSSTSHWLVQLATFTTQASAEKFIKQMSVSRYVPKIERYKAYYRVIIKTDNSAEAYQVKRWHKTNNKINAVIIRNDNVSSNKDEVK